jgi:glycosyltransferase involved in cell wall biosynthesis
MRILIATTHRAIVGGIETYLRDLLPRLAARGHAVALLYEHDAAPDTATVDAARTDLPRWHLDDADALSAALVWRPDVCFLQGLESPDAEEALLDRVPCVLFAHNYHGTCVSGTKRYALPCARPCGRTFGPGCLLAYYPRRCGGLNPRTLWRLYRLQRRRRSLLDRFRGVAVASEHMRDEYLRNGVTPRRLHVLPLFPAGIEPDREPPVERRPTGCILLVGRLTQVKGGLVLVEALRMARSRLSLSPTLVLVGTGPERAAVERAAHAAGLSCEAHGWVGAVRRTELMRGADLLAIPSLWPEPFGLVGIEAGCVGLPAVGFAVGGIPDWLRPGDTGELAPGDPPTSAGLADAIVRALADPEHWQRLRHGAWQGTRRFTPDRHLDQLEHILTGASLTPTPLPMAGERGKGEGAARSTCGADLASAHG